MTLRFEMNSNNFFYIRFDIKTTNDDDNVKKHSRKLNLLHEIVASVKLICRPVDILTRSSKVKKEHYEFGTFKFESKIMNGNEILWSVIQSKCNVTLARLVTLFCHLFLFLKCYNNVRYASKRKRFRQRIDIQWK